MNEGFRKALSWILIGIIIIVFIELLFKLPGFLQKLRDSDKKHVSKTEVKADSVKNEESYLNSVNYRISVSIDKFVALLSNKKYQEAYNLLDNDFKMRLYPSLEGFIKFNKDIYLNPKVAVLESYEKVNIDQYYCKATIHDDNYGDMYAEPYPNPQSPIKAKFTVNFLEGDKFTIAIDGFLSTKEVDYSTKVGQIDIKVKRIDRYYNKAYVTLEIYNGESIPITITDPNTTEPRENIRLSSEGGVDGPRNIRVYEEYAAVKYELTDPVEPGGFTYKFFPFNVICDQDLTKLTFNNIMVGDQVRTAEINFK